MTTPSDATALAPCPLCGEAPSLLDFAGWEVLCKCGVNFCLADAGLPDGRANTIAAWNRRSEPTATAGGWMPTRAAQDVLAERKRQVEREGWTPEHDDEHTSGSMALAAACYAIYESEHGAMRNIVSDLWPWTGWAQTWWKPKDRRHNLIRAAALLLAEIERLDRAAPPSGEKGEGR